MGKIKSMMIGAAAAVCAVLSGSSTYAGDILREAAYFSAGAPGADKRAESFSDESGSAGSDTSAADDRSGSGETSETSETSETCETGGADGNAVAPDALTDESSGGADIPDLPETPTDPDTPATPDSAESGDIPQGAPQEVPRGIIITLNRVDKTDDDRQEYGSESGAIVRRNFGYSRAPDMITLSSGAQLRNCTYEDKSDILGVCEELPELGSFEGFEAGGAAPQVLIYHTHTSESFLPFSDSYDAAHPVSSCDPSENITAVGDAVCEALAKRGISVVHDCRSHDRPVFSGAYYRSAETLLQDLENYPSIKLAIDIHRDGISDSDGSITAPIAEINGKTAAQFMIITGCDSESSPIPDYLTNLKAACLIQNCAELKYPTLARSILFDYRSYNQSLFAGDMLIEVGSQGNSLEEAVYAGELLGDAIADALYKLAESAES